MVDRRRPPGVLGPFTRGMNNRLPAYALGYDQVKDAVNVDLTSTGHFRRRTGYTQLINISNTHSLWSDGDVLYFAASTSLYRARVFGAAPLAYSTLATITAGYDVSYVKFNGVVYYSSLGNIGRIVGTTSYPVGVEVPSAAPTLTAGVGTLYDGVYQVTCTNVTVTGEESGAPVPATIHLSTTNRSNDGTKGIVVSSIPVPTDPQIAFVAVYCTPPNGTVAYRVARLAVGVTSTTITSLNDSGAVLRTQHLEPMPAGEQVFVFAGRLWNVNGNTLQFSSPYGFGLHDPGAYLIPFPADIAVALPVDDGIYVALVGGPTYFMAGRDPNEMNAKEVLPCGAVRRSGAVVKKNGLVLWFSDYGLVQGADGGQIKVPQQTEVAVGVAETGTLFYRDTNGIEQAVAVLFDAKSRGGENLGYLEG